LISGIIENYLKLYILKYGYENTLNFINSRWMWEGKEIKFINVIDFSKLIKLNLSSINISIIELYIHEIKDDKNCLFSKIPLKQLFDLHNINNSIEEIINRGLNVK
jgi:hypothetical protein